MYTRSPTITGVEMSSFRVLGHTDSFGFVSNSQIFLPVCASYPRTQPSPWADTTCTTPPIVPTAGGDHWPCRMRSSTELSSHTSLPSCLLTAMIEGARGDGTLTWLSSCPFEVLTYTRSPQATGEEFARLCG